VDLGAIHISKSVTILVCAYRCRHIRAGRGPADAASRTQTITQPKPPNREQLHRTERAHPFSYHLRVQTRSTTCLQRRRAKHERTRNPGSLITNPQPSIQASANPTPTFEHVAIVPSFINDTSVPRSVPDKLTLQETKATVTHHKPSHVHGRRCPRTLLPFVSLQLSTLRLVASLARAPPLDSTA
jgi:hypothetical protein